MLLQDQQRIPLITTYRHLGSILSMLWKPLQFRLKNNVIVIDSIIRLHNFIIEYESRNQTQSDSSNEYINQERINFLLKNNSEHTGILSDTNHKNKNGTAIVL